jgi:hypothetical protein
MSGKCIGQVTHYYDHLHVAVLALTDVLRVGDRVHILGHSTDFQQQVTSLQINHQPVQEAQPGQDVALKVISRVRGHDVVYRITAEEAKELAEAQASERSE